MDWPAVRWGLMLGDVLAAYRAALDRAAWAVVERGEHPAVIADGRSTTPHRVPAARG